MVRHLEEVFFAPGVGSSLKEGVFAWIKGIGSKVSGSVLRDSWSLEERAGREPMQEKALMKKVLLILFPRKGGRRRRVKRP